MKVNWDNKYEFIDTPPGPIPNWALTELVKELKRLDVEIDISLVGLPDAFPDGGWCIHQEDDVWLVYHSERGMRSGPAVFTSSFDAANFYLWKHVCHPKNSNTDVGLLPIRREI